MNTMLVLLGASTGGPAAVKAFIDALPDKPLPVCFVLANHINEGSLPGLQAMLNEHPYIEAEIIDQYKEIAPGKLYIAPIDKKISFVVQGKIITTDEAWSKPYAPNINELFAESLELKDIEKLAIIFSGMGEDGAAKADLLTERGVDIWCQTVESCIQSSMPESMIKTGKVTYKDDPAGLAAQLVILLEALFPVDQYA